MNSLKVMIACLSILLAFDLLAKPKDEAEVTENLLDEGYTLRQSTVDNLLRSIEINEYKYPDEFLPYTNLGKFVPFTNATSIKILDLVQRALDQKLTHVHLDRILPSLIYDRLRPKEFVEKLSRIMKQLEPSEAKRAAALTLTNYATHRDEGIQCLKDLLQQFEKEPVLRITTAFNLLSLDSHTDEAEAVLLEYASHLDSATLVMSFAENVFAKQVSDKLFNALKAVTESKSLEMGYQIRLARIDEKRKYKIITNTCNGALGDNIIAFPKKPTPLPGVN